MADWGGGVSGGCTIGPIVLSAGHMMCCGIIGSCKSPATSEAKALLVTTVAL